MFDNLADYMQHVVNVLKREGLLHNATLDVQQGLVSDPQSPRRCLQVDELFGAIAARNADFEDQVRERIVDAWNEHLG